MPTQLMLDNELTPTASAIPHVLIIKDLTALHQQYMPYLKNGGLFIPYAKAVAPNQKMTVIVQMPDNTKKPVQGHVIWITPANAQMGLAQGIGVQFENSDASKALKNSIETLLAGQFDSEIRTATL